MKFNHHNRFTHHLYFKYFKNKATTHSIIIIIILLGDEIFHPLEMVVVNPEYSALRDIASKA